MSNVLSEEKRQDSSVQRFVQKLRGTSQPEARVVILTAPGEEGQVDYGTGPMLRDTTGRYRRTRLFVMTLGYSRKSVRLLVFRSSARVWSELHEQAFRRLGGALRVIVLDNLKEGVLLPDVYDPSVNPLYRDVLVIKPRATALTDRFGPSDPRGSTRRRRLRLERGGSGRFHRIDSFLVKPEQVWRVQRRPAERAGRTLLVGNGVA